MLVMKCVDQVSEADLSPELQPLPYSNILMVEVDNVQHEQFTVTEEVKVPNTQHSQHKHPERAQPFSEGLCVLSGTDG